MPGQRRSALSDVPCGYRIVSTRRAEGEWREMKWTRLAERPKKSFCAKGLDVGGNVGLMTRCQS